MSTLSQEPRAALRSVEETRLARARGPCHGKAHLTRDPKAFQVLFVEEERKKETLVGLYRTFRCFDWDNWENINWFDRTNFKHL